MFNPDEFKALLPLACQWVEEQERLILAEGVGLTTGLLEDAKRIGVACPERARLRVVDEIPMPSHPLLKSAAEMTGLISPFTIGQTMRYGIFIHADHWGDRRLVVHELTHTAQYERFGSVEAFLTEYLQECLTIGHPNGPLEQEAKRMELKICGC